MNKKHNCGVCGKLTNGNWDHLCITPQYKLPWNMQNRFHSNSPMQTIELMSTAEQLEDIQKLSKGVTFSKENEELLKLKLEIAELKLALLMKK